MAIWSISDNTFADHLSQIASTNFPSPPASRYALAAARNRSGLALSVGWENSPRSACRFHVASIRAAAWRSLVPVLRSIAIPRYLPRMYQCGERPLRGELRYHGMTLPL